MYVYLCVCMSIGRYLCIPFHLFFYLSLNQTHGILDSKLCNTCGYPNICFKSFWAKHFANSPAHFTFWHDMYGRIL